MEPLVCAGNSDQLIVQLERLGEGRLELLIGGISTPVQLADAPFEVVGRSS